MNTLADQVVELTISLVRALHRAGQLDPSKPTFPRTRARLWKELGRLHRTQPEIGPSLGGAFILQRLEFMQHRGLVVLALTRGITEPEWNSFLEIMSAPAVDKTPAGEGKRLARAILDHKLTHVSVVCEAEQPPETDLPWQVRVAYGRLLSDLRAETADGPIGPVKLLKQSERRLNGMAYSYFRKFDVLRQILFRTSIVDRIAHENPALQIVRTLDLIVHGLPMFSLHGTTSLIFKEAPASSEPPPEPKRSVLRAITERMLGMPSGRQVDETLRAMRPRKIVPSTRLPVELQEWVLAKSWVDALRTNSGAEPPRGSAERRPVRILQKGARYAFV
jgi:hypothetical protein